MSFFQYLSQGDVDSLFGTWFSNMNYDGREEFWAIYLLNAYQPERSETNDPENPLFEIPFRRRSLTNEHGVVLFLELNRGREYDYMDNENPNIPSWQQRPVSRRHELAKEVGFMFGGRREDTDGEPDNQKGLMADADKRMRSVFGEATLKKIRETKFP